MRNYLFIFLLLLFRLTLFSADHYVNQNSVTPTPPYLTWETAATDIQDAITVSVGGETIWVTNGNYGPITAVNITIQSINGPVNTSISGSSIQFNTYHLYPDLVLPIPYTLSQTYSQRGATLDNTTLIGFTVSGCANLLTKSYLNSYYVNYVYYLIPGSPGGGVYGGTISNCIVTGSTASDGGGIANCIAYNSTISGNQAKWGGYYDYVNNFRIIGRYLRPFSGSGGGAINSTLYNCIVSGNNSLNYWDDVIGYNPHFPACNGGGVANCTLYNCTINNNQTGVGGGAYNSTLYNCVVESNNVTFYGGGVYGSTLYNSLLSANSILADDYRSYYLVNNCITKYYDHECAQYEALPTMYHIPPFHTHNYIDQYFTSANTYLFVGAGAHNSTLYNCTVLNNIGKEEWNIISISDYYPDYTFINAFAGTYSSTRGGIGVYGGTLINSVVGVNSFSSRGTANNLYMSKYFDLSYQVPTIETWNELDTLFANNNPHIVNYLLNECYNWVGWEFYRGYVFNPTRYVTNTPILDNPLLLANSTLSSNSPCRDMGINFSWMMDTNDIRNKDLAGNPRIMFDTVDIGCYELTNLPGLPLAPTNPFPAHLSSNITIDVTLTWEHAGTWPGKYYVYFGPLSNWPSLPFKGVYRDTSYTPATLAGDTEYIWRINVSNYGGIATGDVWQFKTGTDTGGYQTPNSYAATNGLNISPYTNWTTAAINIQDAIDVCPDGGIVMVGPGIYNSESNNAPDAKATRLLVIGKDIKIISSAGPNSTLIDGGGYYRGVYLTSNSWLSGFTISNCYVDANGAGIYRGNISNCVVVNNRCQVWKFYSFQSHNCGGGIYSPSKVFNSVINLNSSDEYGGGIYCDSISNTFIYNCIIQNNTCAHAYTVAGGGGHSYGGGIYQGTIYNSLLSGNYTCGVAYDGGQGGGTYGSTLYNCTIVNNTGVGGYTLYGEAGVNDVCVSYGVFNSIIGIGGTHYGSSGYGFSYVWAAISVYNSSLPLQSIWPSGMANYNDFIAEGNITNYPEYKVYLPEDPGYPTNDYSLKSTSLCIDKGNNSPYGLYNSELDLVNNPRICNSIIDMGCYEYYFNPYSLVIVPDPDDNATAVSLFAKLNWDTGVTPIDNFRLYLGTDSSNLVYQGEINTQTFDPGKLLDNTIYYWRIDVTQGTNDIFGDIWSFTTRQSINHYVATNGLSVSPYLTWQEAATNIQDAVNVSYPGDVIWVNDGVYDNGTTTTTENMGVQNNRVVITEPIIVRSLNGPDYTLIKGGVVIRCITMVNDCQLHGFSITDGSAFNGGGVNGGELYNCYIYNNNSPDGEGGAVYNAILNNCKIYNNSSFQGGGVAYCDLYNCSIYNNAATNCGGAYASDLYNCTVVGNSANDLTTVCNSINVYNSIVYYNNGIDISDALYVYNSCFSSSARLAYTINTISDNPLFVGYTTNNFNLLTNSPCIDIGMNLSWMVDYSDVRSRDLNGKLRIYNSIVDMGVYEFNSTNYPSLNPPTNPIPIDVATNQFLTTTLHWDPVDGADNYLVYFGYSNDIVACEIVSSTNYVPGLLLNYYNTNYQWQVGAMNIDGKVFGDIWSFSTSANAPLPTINPIPTNGAINQIITTPLAWEDGGYSQGYYIHYGVDVAMTNCIFTTLTNISLGRLLYNTNYYWRVDSTNTTGQATTGNVWTFNTAQSSSVHYVSLTSINPIIPYMTWDTASTNIQNAINIGFDGDTVWVTNGIYTNSNTSYNRVYTTNNIFIRSVNGPVNTIIEGAPGIRCVYLDNINAGLYGFTLRGATNINSGGGLYGGNAYNCIIINNNAYTAGGVINAVLNNCMLISNSCMFSGGAAINTVLYNSLLSYNNSSGDAGALSDCITYNCTIVSNRAINLGGGTLAGTNYNCISWGNNTNDYLTVNYNSCGIGDTYTNEYNTTNDPLFVAINDFRLLTNSPCIDTGTNQEWMYSYWLMRGRDLDTNNRIYNSVVDMGAYEFNSVPWSNQLPLKAINPSPTNYAIKQMTNTTIYWQDGFGDYAGYASGFIVYISGDTNFITGVDTTNLSYTLPEGYAINSNYYWRVNSTNSFGVVTGDIWTFATVGKVINPIPTNTATDQPRTVTMSWENGGLANSYMVYLGVPPAMIYRTNTTLTNYTPSVQLSYHTNYQWRVDSSNEEGIATGDTWTFETTAVIPPLKAYNPVPANNSSNVSENKILGWLNGGFATSYKVYAAPLGSPLIFYGSSTNRNAAYYYVYTLNGLDLDSYYQWRIDSVNIAGTTVGDVWTFKTRSMPLPGKATIINPINYSHNVLTNNTLQWTSTYTLSNAVYFGASNNLVYIGTTTNNYYAVPLTYSNSYYRWRINTMNDVGTTVGSLWTFYMATLAAKPTIVSPTNTAIMQSFNATTLNWNAVPTVSYYNVYFGKTGHMVYKTTTTNTTYNPGVLDYNTVYQWKINPLNAVGVTVGDICTFTTEAEIFHSILNNVGKLLNIEGSWY